VNFATDVCVSGRYLRWPFAMLFHIVWTFHGHSPNSSQGFLFCFGQPVQVRKFIAETNLLLVSYGSNDAVSVEVSGHSSLSFDRFFAGAAAATCRDGSLSTSTDDCERVKCTKNAFAVFKELRRGAIDSLRKCANASFALKALKPPETPLSSQTSTTHTR
jgi:hypothetical protein